MCVGGQELDLLANVKVLLMSMATYHSTESYLHMSAIAYGNMLLTVCNKFFDEWFTSKSTATHHLRSPYGGRKKLGTTLYLNIAGIRTMFCRVIN